MGRGPMGGFRWLLIFAVKVVVMGLLGMLLWNALIPELFHGPVLSYLQAIGLIVLLRILIGHGGGCRDKSWRHKQWHQKWQQKMGASSDAWCYPGANPGKGKWSWTWTSGEEEKPGDEHHE